MSYQSATFATIDGRNLKDGTLVATASRLRGDAQPFDVEAVTLDIHTNTMTLLGNLGVTDRLDISAALPFVALSLDGRRVDTYRGTHVLQAIASASASGPGRLSYSRQVQCGPWRRSGLAIGGEARLPTGNEENLLGAGKASIKPRLVVSLERSGVAVHGDVGYSVGGLSDELAYSGAITVVGTPRMTLVGEIAGRRLASAGRLTEITESHPLLVGVETIRLTSIQGAAERIVAVIGFKWNIAATLMLSANVMRPVTTAGLNAHWISSFTLDYSFEP